MERLDQDACKRLATHFGKDIPVITSNSHDPDTIVALLRQSGMIISSRFHAIVCALPAEVPCIGISTDSRIKHLMENMATPDLLLDAADPDLGGKLLDKMRNLKEDRGRVVQAASHMVATQLQRLQQMGGYLLEEVRRVFPDYP
jgi:polysaccharide pyruvyl transferase WcaK-like protein